MVSGLGSPSGNRVEGWFRRQIRKKNLCCQIRLARTCGIGVEAVPDQFIGFEPSCSPTGFHDTHS
jgi:hypothetical protein